MPISHRREKLADAILFFVTNTKYAGVTKLFKLLFLLDERHFRETGRSVTGLTYLTWEKGPAPRSLWIELQNGPVDVIADAVTVSHFTVEEDGKRTAFTARRPFSGKHLTERERKIMRELSEIFLDATADQMVDVTHAPNSAWLRTMKSKGEDQVIELDAGVDRQTKAILKEILEDRYSSEPPL